MHWQQQGGFYEYDVTTDYEIGNVVEYSGDLYKCLSANGPNSSVKAPTDTTVWSKVLTSADAVETNLSNTTDYYRLSNGLQILTGSASSSSSGPVTVTFSHAYAVTPRVMMTGASTTATNFSPKNSVTTTGFDFICASSNNTYINGASIRWVAIGIGA